MSTTLTQLVNNMNTCATSAGFNSFKFGNTSHINFDHNIPYDLLNFQYPTSSIIDINNGLQVFDCVITAYRPISKANTTGVEITDNVHVIMTALEKRILKVLGCLGSASNCQDVIPRESIQFIRQKNTHNDRLVSVSCNFSIELFYDCVEFDCSNFPPAATPDSYDCINNECTDPGDGSGTYATLAECEAAGCES